MPETTEQIGRKIKNNLNTEFIGFLFILFKCGECWLGSRSFSIVVVGLNVCAEDI